MEIVKLVNLGIRFALELCMLAALGYSGVHLAKSLPGKVILGAGLPLAAAVIWGAFMAPKALYPIEGTMRLLVELLIFGSTALCLYLSGRLVLAIWFLIIYIANAVLMLVWKQ